MSIKKKVKIALFGVLGLFFLLFATLIIHIAVMVKGRSPLSEPTVQMARVDFKQQAAPAKIAAVEARIRSLKGVKATYFNQQSNILIYTFDNRRNNAENIYLEAVKPSGMIAAHYVPSSKDLAFGCPAMNGNSFYGKLTDIVSSVVN